MKSLNWKDWRDHAVEMMMLDLGIHLRKPYKTIQKIQCKRNDGWIIKIDQGDVNMFSLMGVCSEQKHRKWDSTGRAPG